MQNETLKRRGILCATTLESQEILRCKTTHYPDLACCSYPTQARFLVLKLGVYDSNSLTGVCFLLQIKLEMKNNPVIFLPSHRSYADFILMAYVAFHYEIELPCVAAGMGKLEIRACHSLNLHLYQVSCQLNGGFLQ